MACQSAALLDVDDDVDDFGVEDVDFEVPDAFESPLESPAFEPSLPFSAGFSSDLSPALSADPDEAGLRVAARSFLAQPDPLNRIAGLLIALRSVPSAPQLGQKRGAGSLIPWITSVR
jgi:hypothetical protein